MSRRPGTAGRGGSAGHAGSGVGGLEISELGEHGLIQRIERRLAALAPAGPDVLVGIGDDAAVLASPSTGSWIATCDMLLEGVHFRLGDIAPEDLGHKALASCLSDVAAMGGRARHALVSLALPGDLPVEFVDRFYEGLGALAGSCGVAVVGGDTTGSPGPVAVDVIALGETLPGGPFRSSDARPGDVVFATGVLGGAAAGLALLQRGGLPPGLDEGSATEARRMHFRPQPRLGEAAALAALAAAGGWQPAARDASDGLAAAALSLAEAGGGAIELDAARIPIAAATRAVAAACGLDPVALALYGGEDYELIFTAPAAAEAAVCHEVTKRTVTPVTPVGRVRAGSGVVLVDAGGRRSPVTGRGFAHFEPRAAGEGSAGGGPGGR